MRAMPLSFRFLFMLSLLALSGREPVYGVEVGAILRSPEAYLNSKETVEGTADSAREAQQAKAALAEAERKAAARPSYTNSIGMQFAQVPAGMFQMGSNDGFPNERPVHRVVISRSFYMGTYEVTQAQWEAMMGNNPSNFRGPNLPVEQVSWDDCQEFIRRLNAREGGLYYRLPTEAEWEYACRAGTAGEYAGNLDAMGWYDDNSGNQTHPVGRKQANGWGLYDMHGNVWEWCADWYGPYPSGAVTDPAGPSSGSYRVGRGGSWFNLASSCRSAFRYDFSPGDRYDGLGFRLVRTSQ